MILICHWWRIDSIVNVQSCPICTGGGICSHNIYKCGPQVGNKNLWLESLYLVGNVILPECPTVKTEFSSWVDMHYCLERI